MSGGAKENESWWSLGRGCWLRLGGALAALLLLWVPFAGSTAYGGPASPEQALVGGWSGKHKGYDLLFRFNRDQTCELSFSRPDSAEVLILVGRYQVDFSKMPGALSIRKIHGLDHGLHTILQFQGPDRLKIAPFASLRKLRPVIFGQAMHLKRVP